MSSTSHQQSIVLNTVVSVRQCVHLQLHQAKRPEPSSPSTPDERDAVRARDHRNAGRQNARLSNASTCISL